MRESDQSGRGIWLDPLLERGIKRCNEESRTRQYAEEKASELREDHYAERDAQWREKILEWIEESRRAYDDGVDCETDVAVRRAFRIMLDRLADRMTTGGKS